jgi:hypothetical protein
MKKIFTLLLATVVTVGIASAQSGRYDHGVSSNSYSFNNKSGAIRKINQEFDYRIAMVTSNRRLSRWEKSKQVRMLEQQRAIAISQLKYRNGRDGQWYGNDNYPKSNGHRW